MNYGITDQIEDELEANPSGVSVTALAFGNGVSENYVRNVVARLRRRGVSIYTNKSNSGVASYRIGKPSKTMVATAARAGFFNR